MKFSDFPNPNKRLTPLSAVKFYCRFICCANDTLNWKYCNAAKCPLIEYRKGKRPKVNKFIKKTLDSPINSSKNKPSDKQEVLL